MNSSFALIFKQKNMNLLHYFNPVDFDLFLKDISYNWNYSLGAVIEKQTLKLQEGTVKNVEIAIIGVPFETSESDYKITDVPDRIRKELYQLAGLGKINIIDFGDLKQASSNKGNYLALRDVVDYLNELGIVVLVLGGSQDFCYGICQAFRNEKYFSYSTIDAFLDVKKGTESFSPSNYLSRVFSNQPDIFQFNLLAYQAYYTPNKYFSKTKGVNTHLRLGQIRDDLREVEPIFRNSDFVSFDFVAMKHSDAPGDHFMPNGLRNEEACQLSRYAGLSNRLKVFGLFGIKPGVDQIELTYKQASQVLWYFIEGYLNRRRLKPDTGEGFEIHRVEIKELNEPLVFYRSISTDQWWIQVQALNKEMIYIACSEKDYLEAVSNEIPEFWLKYLQKIDELLK